MNFEFSTVAEKIKDFLELYLFTINQTKVTVSSILWFLLVIFGFWMASKLIRKWILNKLLERLKVEMGLRFAFSRITHYLIMITGTVVAFQFIGLNLSGLAVIFGFLSVGIGFGLQNITSNFVSGLILLFERPIKIGDRVTVGDTEGDVVAINMRSTTIRSLRNITIIVPNSEFISSQVVNWSHGDPKVRLDVSVGVSYNSDLDAVIDTLYKVAKENVHVMDYPEPEVIFDAFGDSSWNLYLRAWLKDPYDYYRVRSGINCDIVRKFRENNIEIPFPQRDLHVRSPLPVPFNIPEKVTAG
ncbi:MAG: mechanosensitive ion channel [Acidobacteria bacterium]|nr:mechanosensitive ion channel [Acidobacteriota bacterium]